jgi:hypothetical protein
VVALPKRLNVEFFEIVGLELKKNCTRDVVDEELLHDALLEPELEHPHDHILRRPAGDIGVRRLFWGRVIGRGRGRLGIQWNWSIPSLGFRLQGGTVDGNCGTERGIFHNQLNFYGLLLQRRRIGRK